MATFTVIPFESQMDRKARRGVLAAPKGTRLYAVKNDAYNLFFAWCYTNEAFAQFMANEFERVQTKPDDWNWKRDINITVHSDRTCED